VLLADDMTLVREGFAEILAGEAGFEVVGQAGTGEAAVELYRRLRPDVLLLDLKMPPGMGGVEATRAVRATDGRARVLILTIYDGDQDITRALAAGAAGYLLKTVGREEFLAAVRAVARGESVIPPEVAARVAAYLTFSPLTAREVQVLRQVATGKANKEIAHAMGISEGTVKTHVINILEKLDCWGRVEAVAVGTRRGYLP
jgi:DNA-binding NarL/FixJ family response regulator